MPIRQMICWNWKAWTRRWLSSLRCAASVSYTHLDVYKRQALSQAIAEARELGDLKENAEYHAAREEQGMVEARVRDIEGRLQNAVIIDVTTIEHTGKVIFGTTVEIANVETDESVTYQIVGEDEADIKQGKILSLIHI